MSVATVERSTDKHNRQHQTKEWFDRAYATSDPEERRRLLDEVIVLNMGMADSVVSRYAGRGVATEDLRQVAYAALTQAAHRFDPAQGTEFAAFAVPTMRGEVRKYFRDRGWMVRPPRRVQELQPAVWAANEELWHQLGRSPRPSEVAAHIGESEEAVIEALSIAGCFQPSSLDKPVYADETGAGTSLGEFLPSEEEGDEGADARVMLQPVLRRLSERDRRILRMRFFEGLTQREIAAVLGITQMQVSRLLSRIFRDLRTSLGEP
jgi:RNA polymerase sigma-B factor